jgi:hypothetical protein
MSNSVNMNMEEKLVQKLKESPWGDLIDDDSLTDLVKSAIEKAFFQERKISHGSWNTKELPPLLVEVATEKFKEIIKEKTDKILQSIVETPEFHKCIMDAIVVAVPQKILEIAGGIVSNIVYANQQRNIDDLKIQINNLMSYSQIRHIDTPKE